MEKMSLHPILSEADIQTLVANYLADPIFDNRRVLVLIPDHTRTAPLPVTADTAGGDVRCDGSNRNKDA